MQVLSRYYLSLHGLPPALVSRSRDSRDLVVELFQTCRSDCAHAQLCARQTDPSSIGALSFAFLQVFLFSFVRA